MNPIRKAIIGSAALLTLAGGAAGLALSGTASAASDSGSSDSTVVVTGDSGTDGTTTDANTAPTPPVDGQAPQGTPPADGQAPQGGAPSGPHQANGITEEVLTGDTAASVEAAVTAAYPDATIERLETDAEGAAYEAHITQADGSDLTVKLDASFAITDTVQGHG
jgi:hypothetical protein